jgi:3-isopropylmalate dehydrogenase
MKKTVSLLPGDGIGPEIMAEAVKVLERIATVYDHQFEFREADAGGAAWEKHGEHLPEETLEICRNSDAILFGAAGGPVSESDNPKWRDCERATVLGLRKAFNFNINLRPVVVYPALAESCPLKKRVIGGGVDILCVRELLGGIYFGEHKTEGEPGRRVASDIMSYGEEAIAAIAHFAFEAASNRRRKVTSVDKANVLDCSRLWRDVVCSVAAHYPQCELEHLLVDNCAMQVITRPDRFDVLLMPNMFGDIISDELSVLAGSLGMLPSASLSSGEKSAMFEPSGGSAPDIAGQGVANPVGMILSAALMLRYSFGMEQEYGSICSAVRGCLDDGIGTRDLGLKRTVSTATMGTGIAERIGKRL